MADKTINIAITREEIERDDFPHQSQSSGCHPNKNLNVITLPTIVTVPLYSKDTAESIKKTERGFYDYYVFLSARSVDFFFKSIKMEENANSILESILENNKIRNNFIAIGPKTKKAIEKYNLNSNLASPHNKAEFSLNRVTEFLDQLDKGNGKEKIKVLMPRSMESKKSNNIIAKTYKNLILDQVFFYETVEFSETEKSEQWTKFRDLIYQKKLHSILFTSPSTVRAFFKIMADSPTNIPPHPGIQPPLSIRNGQELMDSLGIKLTVSLGPKTSEELKKRDMEFLESRENTVKGALEHLLERL
ncbi:MAG: uroporphyrinogen-III synthase [Candidatus Nitrosocosmicus sp.]